MRCYGAANLGPGAAPARLAIFLPIAFCKNTSYGAKAVEKNIVTPRKLGENTILVYIALV